MKRILCSLLVATLPFGSVLADAPQSKKAKVTLVYQYELPNVPGKSINGVLVEYGPARLLAWSLSAVWSLWGKRTLSRQRVIPIYDCTA